MRAYVVSGGKFDRTSHPKWKYRLSENLVVWMAHVPPKPLVFRSHSGYLIGEWTGHILIIYAGYMFDGASSWPDHVAGMPGFALHDFGYQLAQLLTRLGWDNAMLDIHGQYGYWWRYVVWSGVRVGGWRAYGKRDYVEILEL
jgi:hypothetical protein